MSIDEDGILAEIAKGNILHTVTCFGWNDQHDNDGSGRRSLEDGAIVSAWTVPVLSQNGL
jgi:hypothetical protein